MQRISLMLTDFLRPALMASLAVSFLISCFESTDSGGEIRKTVTLSAGGNGSGLGIASFPYGGVRLESIIDNNQAEVAFDTDGRSLPEFETLTLTIGVPQRSSLDRDFVFILRAVNTTVTPEQITLEIVYSGSGGGSGGDDDSGSGPGGELTID